MARHRKRVAKQRKLTPRETSAIFNSKAYQTRRRTVRTPRPVSFTIECDLQRPSRPLSCECRCSVLSQRRLNHFGWGRPQARRCRKRHSPPHSPRSIYSPQSVRGFTALDSNLTPFSDYLHTHTTARHGCPFRGPASLWDYHDRTSHWSMPSRAIAHQLLQMFGVSGYGLHYVKRFANDGKKARWNQDLWDRVSCSILVGCGRNLAKAHWLTILQQSE